MASRCIKTYTEDDIPLRTWDMQNQIAQNHGQRSNLRKCNLLTGALWPNMCEHACWSVGLHISNIAECAVRCRCTGTLQQAPAMANMNRRQLWPGTLPRWQSKAESRAHHQRQHPTHETQAYHSSALHHRDPKGPQMACEIMQNCEVKYLEKPARLDGSPVFLLWKSRLRSFSSWYFETPSRWPAQDWKFQKHSHKLP